MALIPNTQPSALSFTNSLVANQLLTQMNPGVVYQLSNKRSVFNYMLRMVNQKFGGSIGLNTQEIISASRGWDYIQARINTRTGTTRLRLTFDQQIDGARLNDEVFYGNETFRTGRVVEVVNGPGGYIDIVPAFDGSFTVADFPAGALVGIHGDVSPQTISNQKQRRFLNPTLQTNYFSTMREGYYQARFEKQSTRVTTTGGQPSVFVDEDTGMWISSLQMDMLARFEQAKDFAYRFSGASTWTNQDGEFARNGGIKWIIQNRGGDYLKYNSPLTRSQIDAWLGSIFDKNILSGGDQYAWFMGRGLFAILNSFSEDFIRQGGTLNTWAGQDVSGLNIPVYYMNGDARAISIIIDPMFNEPLYGGLGTRSTIPGYGQYTLGQLTGFLMSDAMVQTPDGGVTPQLQQYHFGANENYMGILKGIDANGFRGEGPTNSGSFLDQDSLAVATLQDATQVGVLSQFGIDGTGYGLGWIEPGQ
jgi:hypothetical protein